MTEKFRSNTIPLAGTVEGNVIHGVSVATIGEALGHRIEFDHKSLEQLQAIAAAKPLGIKSRFTHPDWFHDGLGKYLGRVRELQIVDEKLIGDLHISPSAHTSPAGNLAEYILDLAREDPGAFGVSVVVDLDRVWVTSDGSETPASKARPSNAITQYPVARITGFYAADLVDEPALNPDGLFKQDVEEYDIILDDQGNVTKIQPHELYSHMHPEMVIEDAIRDLFNQEETKFLKGEEMEEELSKRITEMELSVMQL